MGEGREGEIMEASVKILVVFVIFQLKSVLNLVSYRASIIDGREFGYVEKVVRFMEKFYV